MRNVFVQIPNNNPTGGMKVANQLARLFTEKGFRGCVVTLEESPRAHWMNDPAECITQLEMMRECGENDIIIDNTNDLQTINATRHCPAGIKIFYSQGVSAFPVAKGYVGADMWKPDSGYTHHWAVSNAVSVELRRRYGIHNVTIVNDMVSEHAKGCFHKPFCERRGVLCLARKGTKYINAIVKTFIQDVDFTIISKRQFTENEIFAEMERHKFFLSNAVHHDIPLWRWIGSHIFPNHISRRTYRIFRIDGFGLPSLEAAACGCIVIGFALGGGLEWMTDENTFLSKDRSLSSLKRNMEAALRLDDIHAEEIRRKAFKAASLFTKDHVWGQIHGFLNSCGIS